jgi:cytochrome c-type biogenesis protein CcmE
VRWAIVGLVLLVAVGYLVYAATNGTADYYRTVAELKAHPGQGSARVLGTVQDDVRRDDGGLQLRFTASQGGASMPVEYRGPVPDIFRPGIEVVVEGRFEPDGVFHASTLLAKCPSRFSSRSR